MKAVQIVNPSEMKVVELEKPAVGVGEVVVRIKYVGFCGSDLNTFLGRNPMVKLPVIPGHEVGAVIEEIGPDAVSYTHLDVYKRQLHGRLGFSHTTEVGDNTTGELYPDLTRLYSATITGRVGSR